MDLAPPSKEQTPAELRFGGGWKIIVPFALLPLLIVSGAIGIFLLFGKLAEQNLTPDEYLRDLRSGSEHRKWQAAYELSKFVSRKDLGPERLHYESEMLDILQKSRLEETQLRRYLLVSLSQVGSRRSIPALLKFASPDVDAESRIYSMLALARIGAPEAASMMKAELASDDPGLRKTAAFCLGFVGTEKDIPSLTQLLDDDVRDVRWNAALGLAQLKSPAGAVPLMEMVDMKRLRDLTPSLREGERAQISLSAVNAIGRLKLSSAKPALETLQNEASDPSLLAAVREVIHLL